MTVFEWPKIVLSYFTFQEPPLSGPTLSIIPSAFSFARCFSIAFAVTPISAARPAAINLPFSERRAMIFSLLLPVFLLPFEVFSLLCTFQNLHKIILHINIYRAITAEGTTAFDVTGEGRCEVRILDKLLLRSMMARGGRDVAPQRQIPTSH